MHPTLSGYVDASNLYYSRTYNFVWEVEIMERQASGVNNETKNAHIFCPHIRPHHTPLQLPHGQASGFDASHICHCVNFSKMGSCYVTLQKNATFRPVPFVCQHILYIYIHFFGVCPAAASFVGIPYAQELCRAYKMVVANCSGLPFYNNFCLSTMNSACPSYIFCLLWVCSL